MYRVRAIERLLEPQATFCGGYIGRIIDVWIKLGGRYFNTRLIFCVNKSPLSPDADTILFPPGASPTDGGYLVHMPVGDVLDKIGQADDEDNDEIEALMAELEEATGPRVDDRHDDDEYDS